jgi:hypothetical protein
MILKEGELEGVRRGNGRFQNSSEKLGTQHSGEEVTEEQRSSGVKMVS